MLTASNHSAFHAKRVTVMGRDSSHIRDIVRIYDPPSFLAIKPAEYQGKKRAVFPPPPPPPPPSQSPSPRPGRRRKHGAPRSTGTAPRFNERLSIRASRK